MGRSPTIPRAIIKHKELLLPMEALNPELKFKQKMLEQIFDAIHAEKGDGWKPKLKPEHVTSWSSTMAKRLRTMMAHFRAARNKRLKWVLQMAIDDTQLEDGTQPDDKVEENTDAEDEEEDSDEEEEEEEEEI